MEKVNRHSQILGAEPATLPRPQQSAGPDNGRSEPEHKPSMLNRMGNDSTPGGMPFPWAMAFAFLVFGAMWVGFWCGHNYSVAVIEKFRPTEPAKIPVLLPVPTTSTKENAKQSVTKAQLDEEAVAALAQVITERLDRRAREEQESLNKVVGSMSSNSTAMQDLTKVFTGELNDVDTRIAAVQNVLQQLRERNQAELDTIQKAVNENSDSTRADLGRLRKEFNDRIAALDRSLVTLAQIVRSKVQHPDEVKLNSFGTEFPPKEEPAK